MVHWIQLLDSVYKKAERREKERKIESEKLRQEFEKYKEAKEKLLDLIKKAIPCSVIHYDLRDPRMSSMIYRRPGPDREFRIYINDNEARMFVGGDLNLVEALGEMVKREIIAAIMKDKDNSIYSLERMPHD